MSKIKQDDKINSEKSLKTNPVYQQKLKQKEAQESKKELGEKESEEAEVEAEEPDQEEIMDE